MAGGSQFVVTAQVYGLDVSADMDKARRAADAVGHEVEHELARGAQDTSGEADTVVRATAEWA